MKHCEYLLLSNNPDKHDTRCHTHYCIVCVTWSEIPVVKRETEQEKCCCNSCRDVTRGTVCRGRLLQLTLSHSRLAPALWLERDPLNNIFWWHQSSLKKCGVWYSDCYNLIGCVRSEADTVKAPVCHCFVTRTFQDQLTLHEDRLLWGWIRILKSN